MRTAATPALLALAFALVAAAGCLGPAADEVESAFGACPHWSLRGPPQQATLSLPANMSEAHELVPKDAHGQPVLEQDGHPFDMVQLSIRQVRGNGTLSIEAEAPDRGEAGALRIQDYGQDAASRSVPVVRIPAGEEGPRLLEVFRNPVSHGTQAEAGPIRITWRAEGADVQAVVEVGYWDRVCGAPATG